MSTPTEGFEQMALDAARNLFLRHAHLPRMVLVELPNGPLAVGSMPTFPHGDPRNDAIVDMLKERIKTDQVRGIAMLAEAWTVSSKDAPVGDLSIHPDRREIVLVLIEHYDIDSGIPREWSAEITRDALGVPSLGEWKIRDASIRSGRLVGLLPPPKAQA